jgi:excisionase family DNA binding protein
MNVYRNAHKHDLVPGGPRWTLTVEEAARLMGISRALAYAAVSRGEIPSIRIGRRVLVSRAQLLAMLERDNSGGLKEADKTDGA